MNTGKYEFSRKLNTNNFGVRLSPDVSSIIRNKKSCFGPVDMKNFALQNVRRTMQSSYFTCYEEYYVLAIFLK